MRAPSEERRNTDLTQNSGGLFHRQIDLDTPAAYAYATEVMASASQIEDAKEGVRSFLEKRKPRFGDRGDRGGR